MTVPAIAPTTPTGPSAGSGSATGSGAPPLVLGPSLGTSTLLWERALPALAARYRVIAWDLPGHGAAPVTTDPFTIGEVADAVADAVDGPFLYAGVSLGGCVGLELLLRHPDRVRAAAIMCSGATVGTPQGWHERAAQVRSQGTSSLIGVSAQRWFAPGSIERDPDITGRLLHALQDADDESYALCCEALAQFDVRDRLADIEAPVLAVWGDHDGVTPEASARDIAAGVQRGRAVGIPDAAHLPPAEDPAATVSVLCDFFDTLDTERAA